LDPILIVLLKLTTFRQKVGGLGPCGPPVPPPMHFANNEKMIYLRKICWLGRMEHVPKK